MKIADSLKNLRLEKNLSVIELAKIVNISHQNIYRWEAGKVLPSIIQLIVLSEFYSCSLDYLVGRENDLGNININANLTPKQQELISLFEQIPESRQEAILNIMRDNLAARGNNFGKSSS